MRKVVAYTLVSVDGVAESPETFLLEFDKVMEANLGEVIATQDAVLLGRTMYDEWSRYWPESDDQPFADFINTVDKHVATSTPPGAGVDERHSHPGRGRRLRARAQGR